MRFWGRVTIATGAGRGVGETVTAGRYQADRVVEVAQDRAGRR